MAGIESPMPRIEPTLPPVPTGRSGRRHTVIGVCAALLVLLALGLASAGARAAYLAGPRPAYLSTRAARLVSVPGQPVIGRLFAANSVWNQPLAANAPLAPASGRLAAHFASEAEAEIHVGTGPWVETYDYSTPIYVVGPFQPTVRVAIDTDQNGTWVNSLQGASDAVPIPPNAQPATGTDSQITIYQPSTDRLWEYWHFRREGDGWHARWGGAIDDVSRSPGYYTPLSWNDALSVWGASGTSLPLAAGTMTLAELRSGHIDHALAITIPYPRAGVVAWPAQRSDGTGTAAELPEGAHLRLNPRLDIPAMHLPKIVEMIALAAQRYGIIVRDQSHEAIGFFAEDPTQYGDKAGTTSDPYYGLLRDANGTPDPVHGRPDPNALFDGMWPSTFFKYFPWRSLEVLKMSLHPAS
jgi:hypothetical protein